MTQDLSAAGAANITEDQIPDELLDQLTQDQLMDVFVEQMIQDKGEESSDALRSSLKEKMVERINKTIASELPDYLVDRLDAKDEISEEELDKAIEEAGIDVEGITEKAMIDFRENYLKEEA